MVPNPRHKLAKSSDKNLLPARPPVLSAARVTTEVSDGDEPPGASDKHDKRERLIPARSTDFVRRQFHYATIHNGRAERFQIMDKHSGQGSPPTSSATESTLVSGCIMSIICRKASDLA